MKEIFTIGFIKSDRAVEYPKCNGVGNQTTTLSEVFISLRGGDINKMFFFRQDLPIQSYPFLSKKIKAKMNTKIKITRFLLALLLALSALGVSASAALAAQPVKYEWTTTIPSYIDVCSFQVDVVSNYLVTEIDFFDNSGVLTRANLHMVAQDTFTANGKTLVGIPYPFNIDWYFDSSGNLTAYYVQGVVEMIPLPDGSMFVSAGRTDAFAHPGEVFILTPDKGSQGNIAGFCAALAP